ncbi:hexokinase A, partial [Nowakowskiella sp. JEL0078]
MDKFLDDRSSLFYFGLAAGISVAATAQYTASFFQPLLPPTQVTNLTEQLKRSESTLSLRSIANGSLLTVGQDLESSTGTSKTIAKLEKSFTVTSQKLNEIVKHFASEMKRGLAQDGQTLKMIPSFVDKRPTGLEIGTYLALDLGGTNFRVCEISLDGKGTIRNRSKKYTLTEDLKSGTAVKMFDFFADCVESFLDERRNGGDLNIPNNVDLNKPLTNGHMEEEMLQLGFTFSFPTDQTAIDSGSLIVWTKGFTATGAEGHDVVVLLQEAFKRKKVNVHVAAMVNDTVGTLISHAYSNPQTYVSVILGTGFNAAYVEKVDQIPKWKGEPGGDCRGAFDDEHSVLPLTSFDRQLDRGSTNPHRQTYEKMVAGMYLGELVRYVLLDLISTGELFGGKQCAALLIPYGFETANMSRIERDHTFDLADTKILCEEVLNTETSYDDRRIIRRVCELVGTRSSRLAGAGITAVVTKINRLDGCTVGIDGSLYEYPHFANRVRDAIRELLGITADHIYLEQARDGSGQGSALIAALASS